MKTETTALRWFENTNRPCQICGKRADGVLRGDRNESWGPHCERCANKRLRASEREREKEKRSEPKANIIE